MTQVRLAALLMFAGFLGSYYWFYATYSADLMATWLAANFLEMGRPDQVYPAVSDVFLMYPPDEWREFMQQKYDYEGPIFPFLYPPIWAKLAQPLADVNFWRISVTALVLNSALLFSTIALAYKATRSRLNPVIFIGLAMIFLFSTQIGTVALLQNQPQILVSFLLVLAIERCRNGSKIWAGAALALAAAIKIYPVFFALYWLFGRERRAFLAFAAVGTALGLVSLFWAGWPLHRAFIEQVSLISNSVLVTAISFNFDAAIAQIFFAPDLIWVDALEGPSPSQPEPGWYTMARPGLWKVASTLALFAMVGAMARAFSRNDSETHATALWPLALILMALLSPISWVYYYIPAACFAPVLLEKLRTRTAIFVLVASFGLIFSPLVRVYRLSGNTDLAQPYTYQLAGVLAFSILAFGFWLAARRAPSDA